MVFSQSFIKKKKKKKKKQKPGYIASSQGITTDANPPSSWGSEAESEACHQGLGEDYSQSDDVGSGTDGAETSGEAVGASFAESPTGGHGIGSVETTGEAVGASFAESLAGGHDKLNLGEESGACSTISSVGGVTAVAPQQRPSSTGVAEVHEGGNGSITGGM